MQTAIEFPGRQQLENNVRLRDLQTAAAISLLLMGTMPQGMAQQAAAAQTSTSAMQAALPTAPQPHYTEPLFLRSTAVDYSRPKSFLAMPWSPYTVTHVPAPQLGNMPRLDSLLHDGKIYLSLSDAITLALENNLDIAIARYNLDIADTDLLRAKAGASLRGVSTGLVTGTMGGTTSTITSGGGPGGTTSGAAGAGTGSSGLVLSTNGAGPTPATLDPTITGTLQLERARTPQLFTLFNGAYYGQNTDTYNFAYNQGFKSGTALAVTFNNSRETSTSAFNALQPVLQSSFQAKVTQHLLQGFGWFVNTRFIVQAKNDRRITDSAFRQQILYTVNQVENIYWALVSAYEDEQAKERALAQSTQLDEDDRKQLKIGTLAPLDVVNADSQVASDKQALIASQTNLEYQQLVMKQAVARNLEDSVLSAAPVIPTDRVSLVPLPEETEPVDQLVRQAYANNPQVEQAMLTLKNDSLTLKAVKNGLLPTVDVYGFYGATAIGGKQTEGCNDPTSGFAGQCPASAGYGTVFSHMFNSTGPDKGAGISINIPLRNRVAQADQARSQLEYRQAQLRLQQIYTQIRMQVINGQYALTNDRAQVQAATAARDYASQSLEAEKKKLRLGASTTANVLQQERNLATAENNLISATAAYAKDRAALTEVLANTLDKYGISLPDATTGQLSQLPAIPGLQKPQPEPPAGPLHVTPGTEPPTSN